MSWDIFSKSKIQYFLEKLKGKFVQKEAGKGLSTNDFDNTYKSKVDKIDVSSTSVSGNPISISGLKSNQLAVNPIITFEPIQSGSGTPSPSNIRPISGYDKIEVLSCGKNIWDGKYSVTGAYLSADGTENAVANWNITSYVPVKGSQNYVVSVKEGSNNPAAICWYDANYTYINGVAWTAGSRSTSVSIPENAKYLRASIYTANQEVQIEEGASATTYEPCNKTTDLSEALGQTVYGGSLDVRTGVLTVDRAIVDLGDFNWEYSSNYLFFQSVTTISNINRNIYWLSSMYDGSVLPSSVNLDTNNIIGVTSANYLRIRDTRYMDATSFKTAVTGQTFCYKLATPFTIQLTPREIILLSIYAYVSINGTNISLDYHNGELASLGDVSQLGETVNEGFKTIADNIIIEGKQFSNVTFANNTDLYFNVTKTGYEPIGVVGFLFPGTDRTKVLGLHQIWIGNDPTSIHHQELIVTPYTTQSATGGFMAYILYKRV